jgi:hypothetical protein
MATDAAEFFQAKESFATMFNGTIVDVRRGENVRAGHPLIEANPEKFQPVELSSRWDTVEQATAAPGEKRRTGRRSTTRTTRTEAPDG